MNQLSFVARRFSRDAALAIAFTAAALLASSASGDDLWADLNPHPQDFLGTLSCTSVTCHGRVEPRHALASLTRQEYSHWLGGNTDYQDGRRHYDPRAKRIKNDADPHALAGQRMQEPRFQEVLKRASNLPDDKVDPAMVDRCAKCHDPLGLAEQTDGVGSRLRENPPHQDDDKRNRLPTPLRSPSDLASPVDTPDQHGIGCESCHGGAKNWIAAHYQRGISRQQLGALGMIDTKNVLVRARLCAACHVGSGDQDINHDMIAAGHPPLRFELASHQALIEPKHWDDSSRRQAEPNYEVQLWAAGRIAAADAALTLLVQRAEQAANKIAPWPEFAESNCFACHQPLRPRSEDTPARASPYGARSFPAWQSWNVELLPQLLSRRTFGQDELPPPTASIDKMLTLVGAHMSGKEESAPQTVAKHAANAREALRASVRISPAGEILGPSGLPLDADGTLSLVLQSRETKVTTWERLCHELAALLAAERALRDHVAPENRNHPFSAQERDRVLAACERVRQRIQRVARSLQFTSDRFEWPAMFGWTSTAPPGETLSADDVADEIESLAAELRRIGSSTGY